jgi:two-component system chemotaxis sensor kinase CheA
VEGSEIGKRIEHVRGTPVFHHRGKLLPLVYLRRVLQQEPSAAETNEVINIIVLQAEQRQLGLVVDEICDTQEIVVKPLGRQLKSLSCYVGATIMGDGRPALILDVAGVSRLAGLGSQTRQVLPSKERVETGSAQPQMLLLFRAGAHDRLAVPLALVDRLEEISTSRIERAGGRPVLHYRDDILPLVSLSEFPEATASTPETMQVVVFANGPRRVGLLVHQVIDIVSETVDIRRQPTRSSLLLGSALIGGKITDFVDLHALVDKAGENWLDPAEGRPQQRANVLLVDPANVPRAMMATFLGASGYVVNHVSSYAEADLLLRENTTDIVLVAAGLPAGEKQCLHKSLCAGEIGRDIPMIELLDREGQVGSLHSDFAATVIRSERQAVLQSLSALTNTRSTFGEAA